MGIMSPGFRGRRQATSQPLPPGQYLTEDFPVLTAGPTPRVPLESWELVVTSESGEPHRWSWPDLTALPIEDLLDGKAWIAYEYDGAALAPEHGGPARLLVPHLYLWKSAKWVHGIQLSLEDEPGFWETAGYHDYGDPWREQRYQGD